MRHMKVQWQRATHQDFFLLHRIRVFMVFFMVRLPTASNTDFPMIVTPEKDKRGQR